MKFVRIISISRINIYIIIIVENYDINEPSLQFQHILLYEYILSYMYIYKYIQDNDKSAYIIYYFSEVFQLTHY